MKLHPKNIFPTEDGIYFALNRSGFVSVCEFKDGKWCENADFEWISFIQPDRSKREDSQKCEMRCSEHCGNTVREVQ